MRFFTRNELLVVFFILFSIAFVSFFNFRSSLRRARDAQRRDDLSTIYDALVEFNKDVGVFPLSFEDGRIMACGESLEIEEPSENFLENLSPCDWGVDGLSGVEDAAGRVYLARIPVDPKNSDGISYRYISNGRRFQIYAYLEGGVTEEGYREEILARNLGCGIAICNYGKALGKTPLEKSLEEYENELRKETE